MIVETEAREKIVRSSLKIVEEDDPTYVIILAIHKDRSENQIVRLKCRYLNAIIGYHSNTPGIMPLGGYVYEQVSDSYLVNCSDYYDVGLMPFSHKLTMDHVGLWSVRVPLPEAIILNNLSESKRILVDRFKASFDAHKDQFRFQYIQFTNSLA